MHKTQTSTIPVIAIILLGLLSLMWGSSFILIKKCLVAVSPLQYVSLRIGLTGLLFSPLIYIHRKRIEWKLWPYLALIGYVGSLIPFSLYGIGQTKIDSSVAGMINATSPIFTLLIGLLFFKTKFKFGLLMGTILGLIGAGILIYQQSNLAANVPILYGLIMVVATIMYGLNSNLIKSTISHMNALDVSSTSFAFAAIPCIIFLLLPQNHHIFTDVTFYTKSLPYLAILVILGTFIANILFFRVIAMTNAVFASTVAYFMPIVAIGWGLLDGEGIHYLQLLGIGFILMGVYFVRGK